MILQRYTFGSKSQREEAIHKLIVGCLWYCKDIHLEANHNSESWTWNICAVAYDIAKIYIWKQITTELIRKRYGYLLLMILQRYTFGSKSQQVELGIFWVIRCLWYCKDIHLEANHNYMTNYEPRFGVAYDIAKIYIWKQITTKRENWHLVKALLTITQRYRFFIK